MQRISSAFALAAALFVTLPGSALAADRRVERIKTQGPVTAIERIGEEYRVVAGGKWFLPSLAAKGVTLTASDPPARPDMPHGALPDGRIATGKNDIARAWLAEPTTRYGHGVLGDAIEAASIMIERRIAGREVVRLGSDAVFEDLNPRLADLDGDGKDEIVLVKSYLDRGSSLAIIKLRNGKRSIVAETPPIGRPNRWLNPAGIADFNGDGFTDIALVRMPHVLGLLELWTWRDGQLRKSAELPNVSNHVAGSRALDLSAVADFDGDGHPDLAIPSRDRTHLRIIAFAPKIRNIANVKLPSMAVTNFALLHDASNGHAIIVGLADGSLIAIRRRG